MKSPSPRPLFKAPPEPHTVIIARGEKVRHWQIRPGLLFAGAAATSTALVGCLASAALFFLSDDVATAFQHREARTVAAYEERISSLRQQLEQATSRQFSERDLVRGKIERLIGEHAELASRFERLEPLLDEAQSAGLLPKAVPVPSARPDPEAPEPRGAAPVSASAFAPEGDAPVLDRFRSFDLGDDKGDRLLREVDALGLSSMDFSAIAAELIPTLAGSVETARARQDSQIARLTAGLRQRALSIEAVLAKAGVKVEATASDAMGGPFVPAPHDLSPADDIAELSEAIEALEKVSQTTKRLPLGRPVDGAFESSSFGVRQDPFLKRKAFHTGLDFAARSGAEVRATAPGKVTKAGYSGGYGRMVEVDHGNGFTTRYAHLSSVGVAVGDVVATDEVVGAVGSTGRSTGPHLHYEVKRKGTPLDPTRFLTAGDKLRAL